MSTKCTNANSDVDKQPRRAFAAFCYRMDEKSQNMRHHRCCHRMPMEVADADVFGWDAISFIGTLRCTTKTMKQMVHLLVAAMIQERRYQWYISSRYVCDNRDHDALLALLIASIPVSM